VRSLRSGRAAWARPAKILRHLIESLRPVLVVDFLLSLARPGAGGALQPRLRRRLRRGHDAQRSEAGAGSGDGLRRRYAARRRRSGALFRTRRPRPRRQGFLLHAANAARRNFLIARSKAKGPEQSSGPSSFPCVVVLPAAAQLDADRARFAWIDHIGVLQRRLERADIVELVGQVARPYLHRPALVAWADADAGVEDRERAVVGAPERIAAQSLSAVTVVPAAIEIEHGVEVGAERQFVGDAAGDDILRRKRKRFAREHRVR